MKYKLLAAMFFVLGFIPASHAQVMTPCLTMEQTQAKYNQDKANSIVVTNTASQQLQTYYQQLATYWQQRDKDNQQKAKDAQQIAKDAQQAAKDLQQIAMDKQLADKMTACNTAPSHYDELDAFIQILIPLLGECSGSVKDELKRIHTNRSGQADGTNPGGQTHNINGFDNPGYLIAR